METAILGGGCFWCLEGALRRVKGVLSVESGYAGGSMEHPTYEAICQGNTGHAEVVKVVFDSSILPYDTLLELFFALHNPTTLNRQGNDIGTQYRSVIFYMSADQKTIAESRLHALEASGVWADPIVTEVAKAPQFYKAEDYHQDYVQQNPENRYCQMVVSPKLSAFFKKYHEQIVSG